MIFISVPFALAVTTIYNLGASSFRLPGVYATSAGFLLVLLFRLAAGGMMTMNDASDYREESGGGWWNGLDSFWRLSMVTSYFKDSLAK